MTINDVAQASGLTTTVIRYYEKRGLVGPIARGPGGGRLYSVRDLHILRFIARLRAVGYSINETIELLGLWRDRSRSSHKLRAAAAGHAQDLMAKATAMGEVIDVFIELAVSWDRGEQRDYPELKDAPAGGLSTGHHLPVLRYIGRGH